MSTPLPAYTLLLLEYLAHSAFEMDWRKSLTLTMVAIVTLFIGCQLPQLILRISIPTTVLSFPSLDRGLDVLRDHFCMAVSMLVLTCTDSLPYSSEQQMRRMSCGS